MTADASADADHRYHCTVCDTPSFKKWLSETVFTMPYACADSPP